MKKIILSIAILSISLSVAHANDFGVMKADLTDALAKLISKYEARIQELESENAKLKNEISSLKSIAAPAVSTGSAVIVPAIKLDTTASTGSVKASDNAVYNKIIDKVTLDLPNILKDNNLASDNVIGLFEFIDETSGGAFFISLDDGKNPSGVTAFKTKILFSYDKDLNFKKIGLFDLDYSVSRYKTLFGSNPYSSATRVRVKNPNYKGKLLDGAPTASISTGAVVSTPNPSSSSTVSGDVTITQIKAAYDKNKIPDALKLSDAYLAKNPNDAEVLKIKYRSLYIIGKYADSLEQVKKIESIQGSSFEKTIACDGAAIAKIAKQKDVSDYYTTICKKK